MGKRQVDARVCLTPAAVEDELMKMKGAVMIVYPMGLPPYDAVQLILDDKEELAGTSAGQQVIPADELQVGGGILHSPARKPTVNHAPIAPTRCSSGLPGRK